MNESTTCDEHDDEEHDHVGLRAWSGGMARALWPSYHHVYNSSTGTSSNSGILHSAINTGRLRATASSNFGRSGLVNSRVAGGVPTQLAAATQSVAKVAAAAADDGKAARSVEQSASIGRRAHSVLEPSSIAGSNRSSDDKQEGLPETNSAPEPSLQG